MAIDIYRCSPRQTREFVIEAVEAGLVPFVQSSPGMGKSSIMRNVAKHFNLKLIDHRLSTSPPEDMSGLPHFDKDGYARFAPFADLFPLRGTALPEGKEGWLINFDEFNSAKRDTQAASYKTILDKMVGQHYLHDNVAIVAAGNLATDRAITNPISTAMQSRMVHIEMRIDQEEWMQDVAITENYDPRIIAFLGAYPSKLMDFKPEHTEKTFCCPRTWEFMDKLIRGKEVTESRAPLYSGTITSGVALEFIQYTKIFAELVNISEIIQNPSGVAVPIDNGTKWAMVSHVMEHVKADNLKEISTYIARFDLPFRILFFRSLMIRHSGLRQHPAFIEQMVAMSRYLNS